MRKVESLRFDNTALRHLPVAPHLNGPQTVKGAVYARVSPTPVSNPRFGSYSSDVIGNMLEVDMEDLDTLADFFSGAEVVTGSEPYAHCYCGHQFGYFSGQLGDGAVINIGEIVNSDGYKYEVQMKGSGLTPFSRRGDGRKVVRSSIREYLCSEHMEGLGIPTTRAAAIIISDDFVMRDMFYDGHPTLENCAIVTRVANSFIRFGSFSLFDPKNTLTSLSGPSHIHAPILLPIFTNYIIYNSYTKLIDKYWNRMTDNNQYYWHGIMINDIGTMGDQYIPTQCPKDSYKLDDKCPNFPSDLSHPPSHPHPPLWSDILNFINKLEIGRDPSLDGDEILTALLRIAKNRKMMGGESGGNVDMSESIGTPNDGIGTSNDGIGTYTLSESDICYLYVYMCENSGIVMPPSMYVELLRHVTHKTAKLVAKWQSVGFCHGVLNSDNMSIEGITIDYGPFGFMEYYSPYFICNSSDQQGRYNYIDQPKIVKWNCGILRDSLLPLISMRTPTPSSDGPQKIENDFRDYKREMDEIVNEEFDNVYKHEYEDRLRHKLGLSCIHCDDVELINELFIIMGKTGSDFTVTFNALKMVTLTPIDCEIQFNDNDIGTYLSKMDLHVSPSYRCCLYTLLQNSAPYSKLVSVSLPYNQGIDSLVMMFKIHGLTKGKVSDSENITAEMWRRQIFDYFQLLKEVPKDTESRVNRDIGIWQPWLEKYITRLRQEKSLSGRLDMMDSHNPKIILRNSLAQNAISMAEKGDFSELNRLNDILFKPYKEDARIEKSDQVPIPNSQFPVS